MAEPGTSYEYSGNCTPPEGWTTAILFSTSSGKELSTVYTRYIVENQARLASHPGWAFMFYGKIADYRAYDKHIVKVSYFVPAREEARINGLYAKGHELVNPGLDYRTVEILDRDRQLWSALVRIGVKKREQAKKHQIVCQGDWLDD